MWIADFTNKIDSQRILYIVLDYTLHTLVHKIEQCYTHRVSTISPEYAVLGFLIEAPCHGYDLHQKFETELGHVWHVSQSQAYNIIKRLEARGDIASTLVEQDKLPARQMLQITEAGKIKFETWLVGASRNARAIRLEFLTRLYFSQKDYPQKTAQIYATQCAMIRANIAQVESLQPAGRYNQLSIDLRLRQLRLTQSWMNEIKEEFHIPDLDLP